MNKKDKKICCGCWSIALVLNIASTALSTAPNIINFLAIAASGICVGIYLVEVLID